MKRPVRVLIVDDSGPMRMLLTQILSEDPEIEVVGSACDPLVAREMIKAHNPDVLTLDVEMPRMDGLTFLEKLMRLRPMPVVMLSSLTQKNCEVTMEALALGAVDFVPKPTNDTLQGIGRSADEIRAKVKNAASCRVGAASATSVSHPNYKPGVSKLTGCRAIAIGASTGGTEAILKVLSALPTELPPIVIVQHIPGGFSAPFAARVDRQCSLNVKVAEDKELAVRGSAYVAPGGFHLRVSTSGSSLRLHVQGGDKVNLHTPSVDVLLHSVAESLGGHSMGVMLTGMGSDGCEGMRDMHARGAHTIAQDEASCVVFGMPARAIEVGAVDEILALPDIAPRITGLLRAA